jgi:hypothetical protein
MPKMMIEIDLPDGQAIPDPRDIVRLTDPDWMANWWSIWDVKEQYDGDGEYSELTDNEARLVLGLAEKNHDSEVGINWEVLDFWIDHVKAKRGYTTPKFEPAEEEL